MPRSNIWMISLMPTLMSCADAEPGRSLSLQSSRTYVVDRSFGFDDALDKRMSLISPPGSRVMYSLMGTDEPLIIGLSSDKNAKKIDGSSYTYFEPEKILRFRLGPQVGTSDVYAEVFDYVKNKAVGRVFFGYTHNYPKSPIKLTQLCTGIYEDVCVLKFDVEANLFQIDFRD